MNTMLIVTLFLILAFIVGIVYFYGVLFPYRPFPTDARWRQFAIGETVFQVDVADTSEKRAQGLSGRDSLGADEGMFFIFDSLGLYGFWMKDMKFDIDIIWIKDGSIVGFSENAKAEPDKNLLQLPLYYPPKRVYQVLEVNAGTVKRLGLKIGDTAELK